MRKLFSFLLVYCLYVEVSVAQLPSQLQQQSTSQQQTSQSIEMPSLTSNMFTTSADFFRNLQNQGMLVQPPPYDRSVDTNRYVLGPGDIVSVGIWGATAVSYYLSVTPEGSLIIPTFGVLKVGGMTLTYAKADIRNELSRQFKNSSISLTLIYPRSFYVAVTGMVRRPGRYVVTSFDRVDRAFTLANLRAGNLDTSTVLPDFSLRRIELVHKDGTVQNVDLLKFFMTGNVSDDPYLRDGDAIVVPKENLAAGSISISGAVKMPGNYEYVPGDRIKDLLELSAGFTGLADSAHARILTWNGANYEAKTVSLKDSTVLVEPLAVNSRVIVPTDISKINDYYVWVTGEVKSPGLYPISWDSTKLSTVISLAGGFTQYASLPNSVILRRGVGYSSPQSVLFDTLSYLYKATGISLEQLEYVKDELLMRLNREEVSTNFVKLFVDKDEKYDCTLRSGDSIYVARNRSSVYVFGQVRDPGFVNYHEGWEYSDYVKAAGGYTQAAERGQIKIIKGGTLQWYDEDGTDIAAGDFLFVPKVTNKPQLYGWDLFKDVVTTIGAVASIATTIVLVIRASQGK